MNKDFLQLSGLDRDARYGSACRSNGEAGRFGCCQSIRGTLTRTANPYRISEAPASLQGLRPTAVMTEARRLARKAIKAQWQAQGRKVLWVEHSQLVEATRAYLDTHRGDLINQARANLSSHAQRAKR
jgi:hypothetical protein